MALPSDGFAELAAIGVVGLLVVAARWVFKPSRPNRKIERMDATDARELGLLVVIGTLNRAEAAERRKRLAEGGIRASTSLRSDGHYDLLVFNRDLERAQEILK